MSNEPRSVSAPPGAPVDIDDSPDSHHGDASVDGSVPSTLYARCHASVSRSLNARRLRQAADTDVQFLQNRLQKLKAEESRARREIELLRTKTQEVSTNKQEHDETVTQRKMLKDHIDYGKRKEAALIALNKERQAKAVWASKQKVMLDRKAAVLNMRKQKEINECRIHILKEESREKHMRQRESIRSLHSMAKVRREREAETKREQVREWYEQRIEEEQAERERKEKLAAQLVNQEAQLIYRLKKMHMEKQAALRGLARSIEASGGSNDSGELPSLSGTDRRGRDPHNATLSSDDE